MKGPTDAAFERLYGTEEQCLAALVAARQREGMPCPRCANLKSYETCARMFGQGWIFCCLAR